MHYECKQCLKPYQYCECKKESEVNQLQEIKAWFEQAIPSPTDEQKCIQIGCHLEEVSEMLYVTEDEYDAEAISETASLYKSTHENYMKAADITNQKQQIDLLDSLADQIVTAVGVAHMFGFDILGALAEVNRSNFSKFEDGKPVFDVNGKITKGKHYTPPQLDKFI